MRPRILLETSNILTTNTKTNSTNFEPFPFVYGFLSKDQSSHVSHSIKPMLQGVEANHQFVKKEKTLQIANEYDEQALFSLIVFACNFVNPYDACARVPSSTS